MLLSSGDSLQFLGDVDVVVIFASYASACSVYNLGSDIKKTSILSYTYSVMQSGNVYNTFFCLSSIINMY